MVGGWWLCCYSPWLSGGCVCTVHGRVVALSNCGRVLMVVVRLIPVVVAMWFIMVATAVMVVMVSSFV